MHIFNRYNVVSLECWEVPLKCSSVDLENVRDSCC